MKYHSKTSIRPQIFVWFFAVLIVLIVFTQPFQNFVTKTVVAVATWLPFVNLDKEGNTQDLASLQNIDLAYETLYKQYSLLKDKEVAFGEAFIPVDIVLHPPVTLNDSVIIYSHKNDLQEGTLVTSVSHNALGIIQKVIGQYARVALFSTPDMSADLVIARTGQTITFTGMGAGNLFAHIPKNIDVQEGDVLVLHGERIYPVATVESISSKEIDPFVSVYALLTTQPADMIAGRVISDNLAETVEKQLEAKTTE